MKKIVLVLLGIISFCSTIIGQDVIAESKKLGLVSYLTCVKSVAEFKMINLAADSNYLKEIAKAEQFRGNYNLIRLDVDKLINQLASDMISANRIKTYKKLNKYLKGSITELPKRLKPYHDLLEEIDGLVLTFTLRTYSSALGGPSIEDILGAVELTHGIIADIRDSRQKKVASIASEIKTLRLETIKNLTEDKKKE
jgi:hypothetical protein